MSADLPAEDDERTRMPGRVDEPVRAENDARLETGHSALPAGTRLGEFEITGEIGRGGFSIVYLVYDHSLDCKVALKEYMPSSFAVRTGEIGVTARSERHASAFDAGLRSFLKEAMELRKFDHPSLLKVHRVWEANGTGYMVMPYYEGPTLKQALSDPDARPSEKWLRNFLAQLLDAVEVLHSASPPCVHRDISPDNILLLKNDRPLLLDFGAARRIISDMAQQLTVVLKPGYAPIEQYAEETSLKQGPWTDVYALAAVVYFAIMGRTPVPSVARLVSDTLVPLETSAAGRYSPPFLRAIDTALSVKPQDRPQNIPQFRRLLAFAEPVPETTARFESTRSIESSAGDPSNPPRRRLLWAAMLGAVAIVAIVGAVIWRAVLAPPAVPAGCTVTADGQNPLNLSGPGQVTLSAKCASGTPTTFNWSANTGLASNAASGSVQVNATQTSTVTPANATGSGNTASVTIAVAAESAVAPPPPPQPPAVPQAPSMKAYDPLAALAEVFNARNPEHAVTVSVEKATVNFAKNDPINFSISSSRPGRVYVLETGTDTDGKQKLLLLFPNSVDRNNAIVPGAPMDLPRKTWPLIAGGPAGIDRYLVIVSDSERDFSAAGMRKVDPKGYGYGEFPEDVIAGIYRSYAGSSPLLAGRVKCPASAQACSESYGAERFEIEEVER